MLYSIDVSVKLEKHGSLQAVRLPTFEFDAELHGIKSADHARKVAHEMLTSIITAPAALDINVFERREAVVSHGQHHAEIYTYA